MRTKTNRAVPHLLLIAMSSCMLVQTTHANTTHASTVHTKIKTSSNSANSHIGAKSTIEQQRKEKLRLLKTTRAFIVKEYALSNYSVDFENRTMSYDKCDITNRRVNLNQCYGCTASFDDLNTSESTALCLKKPEKSSAKE